MRRLPLLVLLVVTKSLTQKNEGDQCEKKENEASVRPVLPEMLRRALAHYEAWPLSFDGRLENATRQQAALLKNCGERHRRARLSRGDAGWRKIERLVEEYVSNTHHDSNVTSLVLAIFGRDAYRRAKAGEDRTVPHWKWQAFWDAVLRLKMRQHSHDGKWDRPREVSRQQLEKEGLGAGFRRGDWPVLLRGAGPLLLLGGNATPWASDRAMMSMLEDHGKGDPSDGGVQERATLEYLHNSGDDNSEIAVEEWIENPELQCAYKSNNPGVWRNWGDHWLKDAEEDEGTVMNATIAERWLDPKGFLAALRPPRVEGESYIAGEVNLNWSGECASHPVRHLPFHSDGPQPQVMCQASGTKAWHLMPLEVSGEILTLEGVQDVGDGTLTMESSKTQWYSPFHPKWSDRCFPRTVMPPPIVVEVGPGDCLVVPQNWWHATEAHGRSVSLNLVVHQRWQKQAGRIFTSVFTPKQISSPFAVAEEAIHMWPLVDGEDAKEETGMGQSFARAPVPTPL